MNVMWSPGMKLEDVERLTILAALKFNHWHRERTAQALGVSVRTIVNKIKLYRDSGVTIPDSLTATSDDLKRA